MTLPQEVFMSSNTDTNTNQGPLSRLDLYAVDIKGDIVPIDSRAGIHPGYLTIADGDYGAGGTSIFAYDPALGQGDVWTRTDQGGLLWSASNTALTKGATLQVKARLISSSRSDQLFYYPADGSIEVYRTDPPGKLQLVHKQTGMRKTWTHLVLGNFNGTSPYHALFFYDAGAGYGEFWIADGQGNLVKFSDYSNLSKGCTAMVTANLVGSNSANDILLYNSSTGSAVIYEVENCKILKEINAPIRSGVRCILAANVSATQWSDLVCYDPAKGEIAIYSTTGDGKLTQFATKAGFPKDWTAMTRGLFRAGPTTHARTHFAGYRKTMDTAGAGGTTRPGELVEVVPEAIRDEPTGKLSLFAVDDRGKITPEITHTGLRSWTHMCSGSFIRQNYDGTLNPHGDLFFYHSQLGEAETAQVGADGKLRTIGKFTGLIKGATPSIFSYNKSSGGIMLFSEKNGIQLYDASQGKMTLLKSFPAWNKNWTAIADGFFSGVKIGLQPSDTLREYVFFNRNDGGYLENWRMDNQLNLTKVWENNLKSPTTWDLMVAGGLTLDNGRCYLTHDKASGETKLFKGGAGDPQWVSLAATSTQPADTWTHLAKMTLYMHFAKKDSFLAYSSSKTQVEVIEVLDDGTLKNITTYPNVGTWKSVTQMPAGGFTRRIAFFSPTGG